MYIARNNGGYDLSTEECKLAVRQLHESTAKSLHVCACGPPDKKEESVSDVGL